MEIRRRALAPAAACILLLGAGNARGELISIYAQRTWQCEVRVVLSSGLGGKASVASTCAPVATVRAMAGEAPAVPGAQARSWVRYALTPGGTLRRLGDSRPDIQAQRVGANVVASIAY